MSGALTLLGPVITIVALGVAAQVLADRLAVPSVLFLILAGIAVGPEGVGYWLPVAVRALLGADTPAWITAIDPIVTRESFGDALPAIVSFSVAIIVFEGAFHLRVERLRAAPRETIRLVTLGAAVSLLATAAVVYAVLGASWPIALLVGALLVATGPTVITPIMNVIAVRERVSTTLETEGVVNDVVAAILAVVTFEYVVLADSGILRFVQEFAFRLGVGVLVGSAVAVLVWYLLRHTELTAENAPQNARLLVLVAALVMYGLADAVVSEAGIAAVATGGLVLGNLDLPYREEVEQFKGDVTLLVLAFVFITLASLLSLGDLLSLGLGGLVVVVVVMAVIRPVAVALCTVGDRFTLAERTFIGAIGPRGIIPASVATLFALELQPTNPEAATTLVGTVFLVILSTVVVQGGFARHIAEALDVIPMRVIIIGGGRVGTALAERLEDRGEDIIIVDNDEAAVEAAREAGFSAKLGDGGDRDVLRAAGAENAKVVACATSTDDVNLLIAQLAATTFGVETVVSRVNDPGNIDAFEALDVEPIQTGMSVAWSMDNVIERPAISKWMTELDRMGDVQEVEIDRAELDGMTVATLTDDLPDDCHLALISRDGDDRMPHRDDQVYQGDHATFIGRTEAVREAIDYCTA